MQRKLFNLILASYLMALTSPFLALAEDANEAVWTNDGLCENAYPFYSNTTVAAEEEAYKIDAEAYEDSINYSGDTCGELNLSTGFLEKGDCSKAGSVITEITEPVAPTVKLNDDTYVLSVYQGLCCAAYYPRSEVNLNEYTCTDVRSIYTTDLETCKASGINCQPRQWLIANSGIGLLKLFVKQIYTWSAVAVGFIAVCIIIFQGVKISISGVSGDISDAKNKIYQAIGGIVLLFLSSLILYTINPDFFG